MSEEELSINVRWKRPVMRGTAIGVVFACTTFGAWLVTAPGEAHPAREDMIISATPWSCGIGAGLPLSGMAEATNADARGNEENGTDRTLRDPAAGRSVGGRLLEERLTRESLRIFYRVYNRLGYGKLESVYRNAMVIEFRESGLDVAAERPIDVWYDGQVVGTFRADIVVEGRVVLELKAGRKLDESAHAQLLNYLSCSDIEVGLLLHFGPTPRFRRAVHSINRERLPYPR